MNRIAETLIFEICDVTGFPSAASTQNSRQKGVLVKLSQSTAPSSNERDGTERSLILVDAKHRYLAISNQSNETYGTERSKALSMTTIVLRNESNLKAQAETLINRTVEDHRDRFSMLIRLNLYVVTDTRFAEPMYLISNHLTGSHTDAKRRMQIENIKTGFALAV